MFPADLGHCKINNLHSLLLATDRTCWWMHKMVTSKTQCEVDIGTLFNQQKQQVLASQRHRGLGHVAQPFAYFLEANGNLGHWRKHDAHQKARKFHREHGTEHPSLPVPLCKGFKSFFKKAYWSRFWHSCICDLYEYALWTLYLPQPKAKVSILLVTFY